MNKISLCKEILCWISQMPIAEDLYLEGGAALNFVYEIRRRFSGDLDFTVPDRKIIKIFKEEYKSFAKKPSCYIEFPFDFTIVENKLFDWRWAKISTKKGDILIKTHTMEDIIAEKICCVLSSDRIEYKDVIDINKVISKVKIEKLKGIVLRKIKAKFQGSRKEVLVDLFTGKKQKFLKNASSNGYGLKNFNNNYFDATRLIKKLLLK